MKEEYEYREDGANLEVDYIDKAHMVGCYGNLFKGHMERVINIILDNLPKSVIPKLLDKKYEFVFWDNGKTMDIREGHVFGKILYKNIFCNPTMITKEYLRSCKVKSKC